MGNNPGVENARGEKSRGEKSGVELSRWGTVLSPKNSQEYLKNAIFVEKAELT